MDDLRDWMPYDKELVTIGTLLRHSETGRFRYLLVSEDTSFLEERISGKWTYYSDGITDPSQTWHTHLHENSKSLRMCLPQTAEDVLWD